MIRRTYGRFMDFLGPARARALFFLFAGTGLFSLVLNAVHEDWALATQTVLFLMFAGGAAGIIFSALPNYDRMRWAAMLLPSFILVVLGSTVLRAQAGLFIGLAFGWIVAAQFIFSPRAPIAYQKSIKAMRKGDYDTAIAEMEPIINAEQTKPQHYRFRAELYRLAGKFGPARRDVRKYIDLTEGMADGYNLLAEVELQAGRFTDAQTSARKALELAPDEWVAAYNLGMIQDRLGLPAEALKNLDQALLLNVPDRRHRLLIQFYRIRAAERLGDQATAQEALLALRAERDGLREWERLMESDQAQTLREVLSADIAQARALIEGDLNSAKLVES